MSKSAQKKKTSNSEIISFGRSVTKKGDYEETKTNLEMSNKIPLAICLTIFMTSMVVSNPTESMELLKSLIESGANIFKLRGSIAE